MRTSQMALKKQLAYGTALSLMGGFAAPAMAQTDESQSRISSGNEDIMVTARKVTER